MPLTLHFLNVGHGDCTFVELPSGRLMMIDINNSTTLPEADVEALAAHQRLSTWACKSAPAGLRSWADYYRSLLVDPVEYYKSNFSGQPIFRYLQTHPDMDHMSGIFRFFFQERVDLLNFWDVAHNKTKVESDFANGRYAWADWVGYQCLRAGIKSDRDAGHKVINALRGDTGSYWTDDGIEVLSPTTGLISECNRLGSCNNCSYVLKISYGGRSVVLPGDAESSAWQSMLDAGLDLSCDLLKAAHHGRESGYHHDAVVAMDPNYVICSVGEKPETDASDEYASHGATVLSTRFHGTLKVTIWNDGEMWINNHKGQRIHTLPPLLAA
jgi:beta-lactamase superfamily II metal-dependent hydrolase